MTLIQPSLRRPGITVFLMPKPGTVQPCMELPTAVPMMRTVVPLGITISSSTASRRGTWRLLLDAIGLGQDAALDREVALVGIVVGPVPLVAGHLDGEGGIDGLVAVVEQPERRDGDDHQDEDRHDRPGDLEHGVVGRRRRHRAARGMEAPHRVEQQAQHEHADQRDDDQQEVVQRFDLLHHRREGRREVRSANRAARRRSAAPGRCPRSQARRSPPSRKCPKRACRSCNRPFSRPLSLEGSDPQNPPQFKAVSTRYRPVT